METMIRRALRQITYCVISAASGAVGLVVVLVLLLVPPLALRAAAAFGAFQRSLLARCDGTLISPPLKGDAGAGWRAVAYAFGRLPVVAAQAYTAAICAAGLSDVSFPLVWGLLRHRTGTTLDPVQVLAPVPFGGLSVGTWPGTFVAAANGAVWVLAAVILARAAVAADAWLARALLGPASGTALRERVRELERTRSLAVDDAAAVLRRVERDLHDGAQVRLTALAMHLGMAREKAAAGAVSPADMDAIRELLAIAHGNAVGAAAELRDLARGIHPPVLDTGLPDALASLAAASPIPVTVRADIPERPTQAIETIAYFCAAELLANAIKHSYANKIEINIYSERSHALALTVTDDGVGGADPARGSGLSGLAQRVSTVDGDLSLSSPPDGPTVIRVRLPLRA
jgi:signal transduction histidine kinase